ncbi:MAG TPA: M48 family metallopeptidase [Thermoanaerobaculia bacterium]|jgi:STE24 endopeptidase|nr:M48 family metallopeptidase [Thermoanaerobaculia bacterium]
MRTLRSTLWLVGVLILFWGAAGSVEAQAPAATPETSVPAVVVADPISAPADFDVEAATRAYLSRVSPADKESSDSYFEGGYWLQLWSFLYGLGVAWLLLSRGISARLRDAVESASRVRAVQTFLYSVGYFIAAALLTLPLTIYQDFWREHSYGLSNMTFGSWFRDAAVGLGVSVILGSLFVVLLYWVFRKAPRTWWIWGTAAALVGLLFVALIAPVYIAPLFNTYKPLGEGALKSNILSLARANGIPADNVYEVDASKQSKRVSANVSGLGSTLRITLNDNLLKRATPASIQAVMGHEMGHYVLNHVYEFIPFFAIVILVGFGFLRWSFDRILSRYGARWGIRGIADPAGLPLLAAILSVYFFVLTPILNTSIRSNEAEADIFGLNASRQPDGFAEVALLLGEYRKLEPSPLEEWIFFDHPSGRSRILMAMKWKKEHLKDLPAGP